MKKWRNAAIVRIISIALLFFTLFSVQVFGDALQYTTDTSDTNYCVDNNGTITPATQNQRDAIRYFEKRALYPWTNTLRDYTYRTKPEPNITVLNIDTGVQYRGIPYELKGYRSSDSTHEGSREHWWTNATDVSNAVAEMIQYHCNYVKGSDCSSSACYAWRVAVLPGHANDRTDGTLMSTGNVVNGKHKTAYTSEKIIKDGNDNHSNNAEYYGAYITKVGTYGNTTLGTYTDVMVNSLQQETNYSSGNIFSNIYAKIKPGDFLVYRKTNNNGATIAHTMLVKKVKIARDENGDIEKNTSYVVTDEQTSSWKECTNLGLGEGEQQYFTSWKLGYEEDENVRYSFEQLRKAAYLPYRFHGQTVTMVSSFIPSADANDSITVSWFAQGGNVADGYELDYGTDETFKDSKTVVIDDPDMGNYKLEKLKDNQTYYLRMRAYRIQNTGEKVYSGYNNYVRVNLETGELYRENAPDPQVVGEKEYRQFIYEDICYEHEEPDEDIE